MSHIATDTVLAHSKCSKGVGEGMMKEGSWPMTSLSWMDKTLRGETSKLYFRCAHSLGFPNVGLLWGHCINLLRPP